MRLDCKSTWNSARLAVRQISSFLPSFLSLWPGHQIRLRIVVARSHLPPQSRSAPAAHRSLSICRKVGCHDVRHAHFSIDARAVAVRSRSDLLKHFLLTLVGKLLQHSHPPNGRTRRWARSRDQPRVPVTQPGARPQKLILPLLFKALSIRPSDFRPKGLWSGRQCSLGRESCDSSYAY